MNSCKCDELTTLINENLDLGYKKAPEPEKILLFIRQKNQYVAFGYPDYVLSERNEIYKVLAEDDFPKLIFGKVR